jgi:hypothetical protein
MILVKHNPPRYISRRMNTLATCPFGSEQLNHNVLLA